jgi:DNA-binding MarR family transcriptional regulator
MNEQEYKRVVNEILVDIFNDILKVEHKAIDAFAPTPLTMSEMHIIEAVGKMPDLQMSDIARNLRVTLPTLTVSVDRLEEKGYIQRRRSPHDRRCVTIILTAKGQKAFDDHGAFHEQMVDALFEDLGIDKMPVLMESLSKLRDFFKQKADIFYADMK